MRHRSLFLVCVFLTSIQATSGHAQLPQSLSEAELRALLPGSTMTTVNTRGQQYREIYGPNGRLTANSTRTDGSCCISDGGRWEIEAGQFCRQYDNWADRRRFCIQIGRLGSHYVNLGTGTRMDFSNQ